VPNAVGGCGSTGRMGSTGGCASGIACFFRTSMRPNKVRSRSALRAQVAPLQRRRARANVWRSYGLSRAAARSSCVSFESSSATACAKFGRAPSNSTTARARPHVGALGLRSLGANARVMRPGEVAPKRRDWVTGLRGCGGVSSAGFALR
jgi:hypothetical protein